nr:MAG: hypothetical protein DIU56_16645 [Pseudomonadota bacterium]
MGAATHTAFKGIVLGGALRFRGMPAWDDVFNEAQVEAIHAYLIDLAWRSYEAQQNEQSQ